MVSSFTLKRWMYYLIYILICITIISLQLQPLKIIANEIFWPDFIFMFTTVWLLRRPQYLPFFLIISVHFISDLLLFKPIGLWSAISIVGYEFIRRLALSQRVLKMSEELLLVSIVFTFLTCTLIGFQFIFKINNIPLSMMGYRIFFTIALYPGVVLFTHYLLSVRWPHPSDFTESREG
ncbi:MAG: hypothetical protein O3A15_00570 [Proteobacteria bacterium]|jgi:rod shape-determining protein MreD|nr:hypothetical protein [Pseudomonadota bacterium]